MIDWLCERAFRSRLTLREEGQVELLGEAPNELSAVQLCPSQIRSVNSIFQATPPGRWSNQLARRIAVPSPRNSLDFFVSIHSKAPSIIAVRICNKDCLPLEIDRCDTAPTEPGFAKVVSDDFRVYVR